VQEGYRGVFSEVTVTCDRCESDLLVASTTETGCTCAALTAPGRFKPGRSEERRRVGLSGGHVPLDCVFQQLGVGLDVQSLHHPVLVKCHRPRLDVDHIGYFFHRQTFRQ
jgi:hypothetical protein